MKPLLIILAALIVLLAGCTTPAEKINAVVKEVQNNTTAIQAECQDGIKKIESGEDATSNFKRIEAAAEKIDDVVAKVPPLAKKQEEALEKARSDQGKL